MKTTIPLELDLEVTYTAHKATKGARDSLGGVRDAGPPLEPDEPASIEIEAVRHNGVLVRLDDAAIELLYESLAEQLNAEHADEYP